MGQHEPDTAHDFDSGMMWRDAPREIGGEVRIYFQAYPVTLLGAPANVAHAHTRTTGTTLFSFEAILGIWRDCDGDGFLGHGVTGQLVYRAELLPAALICPAETPQGLPVHNDGTTVRELIPFGRGERAGEFPFPGAIEDVGATVWGDRGVPGEGGHESCRIAPLPRGSLSNTGRAIRSLDCVAEHRLIGVVNTVDNDGSLGLAIEDVHKVEDSDSLLVQQLPVHPYDDARTGQTGLVQPGAERAAFEAWDCDDEVTRAQLADGQLVVRRPAPALHETPTDASWLAGAERAAAGATGECDDAPPVHVEPLEQPTEHGDHLARRQNDVIFRFGERGSEPPRVTLEPWQMSAALPGAPGGFEELPVWRSPTAFIATPQVISRSDLQPRGAEMWSFYATLGDARVRAGAVTPSSGGVYGAEACGASRTGAFACDPAEWWQDPYGDVRPRHADGAPMGATPGQTYQMRDVDCFDGQVGPGAIAYTSLAAYSEGGTCEAPFVPPL